MGIEHQHTAEPQHNHNHDRAQEFTHGMCRRLADIHPHDIVAIGGVDLVETAVHLPFGTESLDDAQTTECFFHLTHRIAPECLGLDGVLLQLTAYPTHKPAHNGYDGQCEECQLPRDKQ